MHCLNHKNMGSGSSVLFLLLMTLMLASCGDDDPVAPAATNGGPTAPVIAVGGPADAAVDVALTASLHWSSTDPDGDALTYTVHFGTAAAPPVVAEDHASATYTPAGLLNGTTYHWQITASDGKKATNSPVWSFTTVGTAAETVTPPAIPGGAAAGEVGATLPYTVTGGSSSEGHALEYRLDWGDGTYSDWGGGAAVGHAWSSAGVYDVRAQARCIAHPALVSDWSAAATVTISEPAETVVTPLIPSPTASAGLGESVDFQAGNSSTNLGHPVEYRFDWGDGSYSDWGPVSGIYYTASHAWSGAGNHEVRAQARCATHPEAVSDWTAPSVIEITAVEAVTPPILSPVGERTVDLNGWLFPTATLAESNMGHAVELQWDLGTGSPEPWGGSGNQSLRFLELGDFTIRVRARCQEHTDVVSDWSGSLLVHVVELETIDGRPALAGPATVSVGVPAVFTVSGVASSQGHDLEYQLYDGYNDSVPGVGQGWTTADNLSITWNAAGNRFLQVQARCAEHPGIESVKSFYFYITITN